MANLTGPKGPSEPKSKGARPVSDKTAGLEKREKIQEKKHEPTVEQEPAVKGDTFGEVPSIQGRQARELPASPGDAGSGGSVKARLHALGLKGGTDGLIKTAGTDAIRYSAVPGGRILHGSLAVESTRSLAKLEGVVRVTGDLSIQESVLKSAELLVLKSLTEVGGRLTLEGNAALQLIDAFENLERARGIYVGFNPGIARVSLPKLREIEAALIFEANTALTEINLPAFSKGGLYVHVHDNQALTTVLLPSLSSVQGELSFLDNPRLITVRLASRAKPATVGALELAKNGAADFPLLFANVVKS
ncbi:MAG: hypothetical protein A2138_26250 [Deltaproteobacteria bacterium RBG_16_71_12]|nr:MAG: hypothetical protein A2138_26250 [Deltaproteobacteria bacterium RBG_16_71_12]